VAAALGVATAGVAYLAGAVLASPDSVGADAADSRAVDTRRAVAGLRDLSSAAAGLGLGLLVPAAKLPGALAGGLVLAAVTGVTKVLTGWWAAARLGPSGPGPAQAAGAAGGVGRPGRLRAGLTLVPRGELAVAIGLLAALSGPDRSPGAAMAALAAVEVVLTGAAPSAVRDPRRPGWYRWAVPTAAAVRPESSGAG
jgi:CPA2 family monovalent cation:H+ antiporter-2